MWRANTSKFSARRELISDPQSLSLAKKKVHKKSRNKFTTFLNNLIFFHTSIHSRRNFQVSHHLNIVSMTFLSLLLLNYLITLFI